MNIQGGEMTNVKKILVVALISCFGVSGVLVQAATPKKAVLIIAQSNFQDDEFLRPKEILEASGIEVIVASTTLSQAIGMNGAGVKPDMLVKNIKVADFDAVVFIGGSGATQYLTDPLAHSIAQEAIAKNKIVGAICIAPVILTNAGILKGKKATVYPSEADKLKAGGVNYTGKPLEKDGLIITADGPKSAKEFGEEISRALLVR
jgi:protease I